MTSRIPFLLLPFLLPACVVAKVGDGDPASLGFELEPAEAISLTTLLDTTVTVSPQAASTTVVLSCDESLLDEFDVTVRDGVLRLGDAAPYALVPRADCTAEVDLPALVEIDSSGSGHLEVVSPVDGLTGIDASGSGGVGLDVVTTPTLSVTHSGSGPVYLDALTTGAAELDVSGSGGTWVEGTADNVVAELSGSGGLGEFGFTIRSLTLDVSGSGGAELTVTEAAVVHVSGSGGVTLRGDPAVRDVETSGSGEVAFE